MSNPEQSKNLTQPQESIGRTLSRRDFLKAAGMVGAAVLANRYLGPLVGVEGAPLPLGADVIFSNLKKEQEALEAKPDTVYGWTFKTDAAGGVTDFYAITEAYSQDDKRTPLGRYLFKSSLDATTGKFSKFNPISSKLPIAATSIAVYGNALLLGGAEKFPEVSNVTALLYIPDDKPFTPITQVTLLANYNGGINEIKLLPNTAKAILSAPGFELRGSQLTFDFNTLKAVQEGWSNSDYGTRGDLVIASTLDRKARFLSPALTSSLSWGYVDTTRDPVSGQVLSVQLKHPEVSYALGLAVTKDQAGLVKEILIPNIDSVLYTIDDKTDSVKSSVFVGGWLNGRNIPNSDINSLTLGQIQVIGNNVWSAGTYQSLIDASQRALLLNWPLGSNPGIDPSILKVYQLEDKKPSGVKDMQFGIFNGKFGLIKHIFGMGLAFTETATDGTSLPGVKPIYIGQGLGELHQTFLPNLDRKAA